MIRGASGLLVVVLGLVAPAAAFAGSHADGAPGRSERAPGRPSVVAATPTPELAETPSPSPEPRGILRRREHAERFVRVQGVTNGMINKLNNLAARLNRQVENFERRMAALRAAGHTLTVDVELAVAKAAVANAQTAIARLLDALRSFSDSETPRRVVREVRSQIRELKSQLRTVRVAFQSLREAIRDDVRAGRPSPTATASPVGDSPAPSVVSPSPTATP